MAYIILRVSIFRCFEHKEGLNESHADRRMKSKELNDENDNKIHGLANTFDIWLPFTPNQNPSLAILTRFRPVSKTNGIKQKRMLWKTTENVSEPTATF